jgi:arginyl-tRNA synthetase
MIQVKQDLSAALQAALQSVTAQAVAADGLEGAALAVPVPVPIAAFESPKQAAHGDLAVTAAMPLAKSLKKNPREIATALVAALNAQPAVQRWVQSLEIAGPGFINLRLSPAAKQTVVTEVLTQREAYGRQPRSGQRVMVEFVSANPTGPLHVGHARQAALGDALCALFQSQGRDVTREFYYNDAGVQIATLARSTQLRIQGHKPGDPVWPTDPDNPESKKFYNGDYIQDIADAFLRRETVTADDRAFTATGDPDDLDGIRQFAVAYLRHEQDLDLQAFGLKFDNYFLESSVYANGALDQVVQGLVASGKTYEKDGALWFRSTDYGDDQDRVMRKSGDGSYTYFVPDVAYHVNKFQRGYRQVINVQGSDHHGTVARVRGGLQALSESTGIGIPPGYPDYVLHKMVTVMKGGEEVKISKRAGSYVTLRDLVDWTSRDAVRFFLISRKADTEFVFDIDLALKANDENPVFYVQYAHARICSVLARHAGDHPGAQDLAAVDLSLLTAPSEADLMLKLAEYPAMLSRAAAELAPHDVAFYLRGLAAAFHSYYAAERFLVDDPALARARMALLAATAQVLRNALALLGVAAPEAMGREAAPAEGDPADSAVTA